MNYYGGDLSSAKFIKDASLARKDTPREGQRAPRQAHGRRAGSWGFTQPSACGSYRAVDGAATTTQACEFPYWHMLLWGVEPVYRLMRNHPTLALARYIVTGPILASPWDYTWTDGLEKPRNTRKMDESDPAVRFLKQEILPLRRKVMRDAIRAVDFGWQPFATPWEIRNGLYVPGVTPLLPDSTTVLLDGTKFAGLENQGESGDPVKFNNLESWAPSLDGEAGYPYGRSRYENIRDTAWAGWLNTVMRMREVELKLAGIIPIVSHAPNGYIDDDGNAVNYSDEANTVLQELPQGRGIRLEALFDPREVMDKAPELADKISKLKVIDVDFYDAGSVASSLQGFISTLEYYDKNIFRGMLRGERSGLEAVAAGSRADSEQHSMMGAADSESIDADITESFDEHVVFTTLRLNFGEETARRLHVVSTPLQEWKKQVFLQVITRLVSIPSLAADFAKALDVDAMLGQMSLPQIREFVVTAIEKNPEPPADAELPPKTNGNGKMNGKDHASIDVLAKVLHETTRMVD